MTLLFVSLLVLVSLASREPSLPPIEDVLILNDMLSFSTSRQSNALEFYSEAIAGHFANLPPFSCFSYWRNLEIVLIAYNRIVLFKNLKEALAEEIAVLESYPIDKKRLLAISQRLELIALAESHSLLLFDSVYSGESLDSFVQAKIKRVYDEMTVRSAAVFFYSWQIYANLFNLELPVSSERIGSEAVRRLQQASQMIPVVVVTDGYSSRTYYLPRSTKLDHVLKAIQTDWKNTLGLSGDPYIGIIAPRKNRTDPISLVDTKQLPKTSSLGTCYVLYHQSTNGELLFVSDSASK